MPLDSPGERRSIPLSALEHYAYCPKQAILIHTDAYFDSNLDTVRGDLAHTAVDRGGVVSGGSGSRTVRSLPVWSERVGLHGVCDVVELTPDGPVPVEHKSGVYRPGGPAYLQVAGQVECLRTMFNAPVPIGVVFSGRNRRRHEVVVGDELMERLEATTSALRGLLESGALPAGVNNSRCRRCSLRPGCLPEASTDASTLFTPRPLGTWCD